jgi:uracil-DNA glycosylase
MPVGGVMILGHDFHSEDGFEKSLALGTEVPPRGAGRVGPTWDNLLRLLDEATIPRDRCFYTNAYMGLTGRFPGSLDPGFVERCRGFLRRQLAAQRPNLILTLGAWVPAFIAPLSPDLGGWSHARSLAEVDRVGGLVARVRFDDVGMQPCNVVALTHPSLRGPNVVRRRFRELTGHEAELAMVREALGSVP